MNSNCPACETILRNPRYCSCGWRLNADAKLTIDTRNLSAEQLEHNRQKARELVEFAKRLASNQPYEPGAEG